TPTIALGAKSLKAVIQNPYAAIFPEVHLEGQVIKKESSKKIAQRTLKNVRFVPNSSMNFHLDLGKQPQDSGTYIFTRRAILQQDEQ
ncbi:WxL protein host-binding domain-containing protein, partial [Enterococcus faecalis]|uniref:WxL protein host-binding domain-containing protein n=1 Tax=Enterococcus faecalis TaxID=1351 RepID=UPI003D6AC172